MRSTVVIIDDDEGTRDIFGRVLATAGYEVLSATNGTDGLGLVRHLLPHVVLMDLCLPDTSGLELLAPIRRASPSTDVVLMTGFGTVGSAVRAMKLGACDYLEKPVDCDQLIRVLEERSPLYLREDGSPSCDINHASRRWARAVAPLVVSPEDATTVRQWASWIAASDGAVRSWCRTIGLSPKRSLSFGRMLRVVERNWLGTYKLEELLDVSDSRTLRKMLQLGGRGTRLYDPNATTEQYISAQRWRTDASALQAVVEELRRRAATPQRTGPANACTRS